MLEHRARAACLPDEKPDEFASVFTMVLTHVFKNVSFDNEDVALFIYALGRFFKCLSKPDPWRHDIYIYIYIYVKIKIVTTGNHPPL